MLNELIFILHIISVTILGLIALRLGKSALISIIALQCIVANIFVTKQIILFGFNVTGTDVFIIGAELSLNLLQEFYGTQAAKKAIKISFLMMLSFLIYSVFQLWYTPSNADTMHPSFYSILKFTPRIIFASILAYFLAQSSSVLIFGFLKKISLGKFLALRSALTCSLSQFIDTVVFTMAALYGITYSVAQVITLSFTIKLFAIALATPFIVFAKTIFNLSSSTPQDLSSSTPQDLSSSTPIEDLLKIQIKKSK
jgi:queuosine precursor transporter